MQRSVWKSASYTGRFHGKKQLSTSLDGKEAWYVSGKRRVISRFYAPVIRERKMAIEIIKRGLLPDQRTYTVECHYCTTIFKCQRSDGKLYYDQRDGDYFEITCPLCKHTVYVSVRNEVSGNARPSNETHNGVIGG